MIFVRKLIRDNSDMFLKSMIVHDVRNVFLLLVLWFQQASRASKTFVAILNSFLGFTENLVSQFIAGLQK